MLFTCIHGLAPYCMEIKLTIYNPVTLCHLDVNQLLKPTIQSWQHYYFHNVIFSSPHNKPHQLHSREPKASWAESQPGPSDLGRWCWRNLAWTLPSCLNHSDKWTQWGNIPCKICLLIDPWVLIHWKAFPRMRSKIQKVQISALIRCCLNDLVRKSFRKANGKVDFFLNCV